MKKTLIIILGPTAVGKTRVAIDLARRLNTEIISADSRQFYRELSIGTASPTCEELLAVPHHFVGHLSVADYYNVFRYEQDVIDFLNSFYRRVDVAVMVGGSGLYIDAVLNGIDELPDPDPVIRKSLKELLKISGLEALQQKLLEVDPDYYRQVDLNNPNRLIRALEVWYLTGKPCSSFRKLRKAKREFSAIKVGLILDRAELVELINRRVEAMIHAGLVEEVRGLLPFRHENALNTLGYKEIFAYLDGKCPLDEAVEKIKTNTRRFAKRQMTWFRKQADIQWFHPDNREGILDFLNPQVFD